jgi:hypothetical protein
MWEQGACYPVHLGLPANEIFPNQARGSFFVGLG